MFERKGVNDMSQNGRNAKVVEVKRRYPRLLGILFFVFSVYIFILFVVSNSRDHVSIYEVSEKEIAEDETIRGLILRNEELVTASESGYVNYYVSEGSKVGLGSKVYSVDQSGNISEKLASLDTEDVDIQEKDSKEVRTNISEFRDGFTLADYSKINNFRYEMDNTVLELSAVNLSDRINKIIKREGKNSAGFEVNNAKKAGVVSFLTDGMEEVNFNNIKSEYFDNMNDNWKQLRTESKVESGTPIYKIVTNENWAIILPLNTKQYEKVKNLKAVYIAFSSDEKEVYVPISTFKEGNRRYAKLQLNKYMIRYLDRRYIDVSLKLNTKSGLKIPNTAVFKKDCYVFPKKYLSKNTENNTTVFGVDVRTTLDDGTIDESFHKLNIYYIDNKNNVYIDKNLFNPGTMIFPSNNKTMGAYELVKTKKLKGVYNCNQGYCVFQMVNEIYHNDEYTIVEGDTLYSLSAYDHIILNPKMINENDIIY